jgi:hypothetical protein
MTHWKGVVHVYRCLFSGTALLSTWKSTSDTVTQAHRPLHLSTHGGVRNIHQSFRVADSDPIGGTKDFLMVHQVPDTFMAVRKMLYELRGPSC